MGQNLAAATVLGAKGAAFQVGDKQGNAGIVQGHGPAYNAAYGGRIGLAACVGITTSAGLAATYTGLCLSNPAGSGVNLSLLRAQGALDVAPAALTTFGLIVGYAAGGITVHTTALVPQNGLIGTGPALAGLADSAATLVGTPAWAKFLAVTIAATGDVSFDENVGGEILIPPGAYVAIGTSIAGPANGLYASFTWEENPV